MDAYKEEIRKQHEKIEAEQEEDEEEDDEEDESLYCQACEK